MPLAVEVVLIAFRTGLCAETSARSLENSNDKVAPWATVVNGTDDKEAQAAMSGFHESKVCLPNILRGKSLLTPSVEDPKI